MKGTRLILAAAICAALMVPSLGKATIFDTTTSVGTGPKGLALDLGQGTISSGSPNVRLFVASETSDEIYKIDLTTEIPTPVVTATGLNPFDIAYRPDLDGTNPPNRLYVLGSATPSDLTVLHAETGTVLSTLSLGGILTAVEYHPNIDRVLVSNATGFVHVIDPATDTQILISPLAVPGAPGMIGIDPTSARWYVSDTLNDEVHRFSGNTLIGAVNLPAGANPRGIAINPVLNRGYVAGEGTNAVYVFNPSSGAVTTTVGGFITQPIGLTINPVTQMVYVANTGDNTVGLIEGITSTPITKVNANGFQPYEIVLSPIPSPAGGNPSLVPMRLYVSNAADISVTSFSIL